MMSNDLKEEKGTRFVGRSPAERGQGLRYGCMHW